MSTVNASPTAAHGRFGILSYIAAVARDFTPSERARAALMFVTILRLHIVGFAVFILFVVPSHYKGLGIGVAGAGVHARACVTRSTPITSPRSTTRRAS